jgi:hypothetical protein
VGNNKSGLLEHGTLFAQSCSPNLWFYSLGDKIVFEAMQDINSGTVLR